jgi:hypothetical protein
MDVRRRSQTTAPTVGRLERVLIDTRGPLRGACAATSVVRLAAYSLPKDACPLIRENAFAVDRAGSHDAGTLECMRAKRRDERSPGVFDMWPC